MAFDKDLRGLLKAVEKVSRTPADGIKDIKNRAAAKDESSTAVQPNTDQKLGAN